MIVLGWMSYNVCENVSTHSNTVSIADVPSGIDSETESSFFPFLLLDDLRL